MNRLSNPYVIAAFLGFVTGGVRLRTNNKMAKEDIRIIDEMLVDHMMIVDPAADTGIEKDLMWRDKELKRIMEWQKRSLFYRIFVPPPMPDYISLMEND